LAEGAAQAAREAREIQGTTRATDRLTTSVTAYNAQTARLPAVHRAAAAGAKLQAHEMLNLSRQFADIGVTAAMGMNPLMILIQQGPQIGETFAMASARGITFRDVLAQVAAAAWAAVAPLLPFIAAAAALAGVVGGGLLLATRSLNKEF